MAFNPMRVLSRAANQNTMRAAYKAAAGTTERILPRTAKGAIRGTGEGFTFMEAGISPPGINISRGSGALTRYSGRGGGSLTRYSSGGGGGGALGPYSGGGGFSSFGKSLLGSQLFRHAGIGALAGGTYGAMSDNTSVLGGALGGAVLGTGIFGARAAGGAMRRGATFSRAVSTAGSSIAAETRMGYHGARMASNRGMNSIRGLGKRNP